jgi:hypothetical protein
MLVSWKWILFRLYHQENKTPRKQDTKKGKIPDNPWIAPELLTTKHTKDAKGEEWAGRA